MAAASGVGGEEGGPGDGVGLGNFVERLEGGIGEAATGKCRDEGGAEDEVRVGEEAEEAEGGGKAAGGGVGGDEGRAKEGVGVKAELGEVGVDEGAEGGGSKAGFEEEGEGEFVGTGPRVEHGMSVDGQGPEGRGTPDDGVPFECGPLG